jgi:hypothetical protein
VKYIHWVGEAPTSLHGNGANSFARTTRNVPEVSCPLCRTLLARTVTRDTHPAEHGDDAGGGV